jgi:hypothetical protein
MPLHIDDRTERAVERAAAARVNRPVAAHRELPLQSGRDSWQRFGAEVREIFEEVVHRPQLSRGSVAEERRPSIFDFAKHQRDAFVDHRLALGRNRMRHGDGAADVESADHHVEALCAALTRQILGARKLIGLHACKRHQHLRPGLAKRATQTSRINAIDAFVKGVNLNGDRRQRAAGDGVLCEAVQAAQRVAWQRATPMPHDVPVLVVAARANQHDDQAVAEEPLGSCGGVSYRIHAYVSHAANPRAIKIQNQAIRRCIRRSCISPFATQAAHRRAWSWSTSIGLEPRVMSDIRVQAIEAASVRLCKGAHPSGSSARWGARVRAASTGRHWGRGRQCRSLKSRRRRPEPLERQVAIVFPEEPQEPFVVLRRHVEELHEQPIVAVRRLESDLNDPAQVGASQIA